MVSKAELEEYLKREWAKRGFPVAEGESIGVAIDELVSISKARNEKLDTPYLDLWILILDECICWFVSLLMVFYAKRDKSFPFTNFDKSLTLILSKIIGDSTAMRHLVLLGFDTSARAVLRSVSEYMEVMVALLHQPEFADEFIRSDTPEAAQAFWKTHLSRGGIRRRVTAAWKGFLRGNDEAVEWFANWGRRSNPMLSGLAHPSSAGGFMTALMFKTKHVDENWLGVWGDRSDQSAETIFVYTQFVFPILLIGGKFPFDGFDRFMSQPIPYDEGNELHRSIRIGGSILASLILSVGSEDNAPHFFPEIDLSYMPEVEATDSDR